MSVRDKEVQKVVLDRVVGERDRQDDKFGDEHLNAHPFHWLRILTEEVGEVAAEVALPMPYHKALEEELVQVAAVAIGWLEDIEHDKVRNNSDTWSIKI